MSFFIEGSWKEWFLKVSVETANSSEARCAWIGYGAASRLDSHPVADLCRVGFAPQPRMSALRFVQALARIRPSFFGNSFFSHRAR
ncbi:hypothetical protein [Variovorax sp. efr-133-TYG-130]|uniref:hypothetical protein n=1 Tax=Variovorax sp. efr-133-TYG-130 TaxID=3040327 RepID=UPI002556F080|nr:hypothetical protein [Variovorax sp. efr-133-TYG-130]